MTFELDAPPGALVRTLVGGGLALTSHAAMSLLPHGTSSRLRPFAGALLVGANACVVPVHVPRAPSSGDSALAELQFRAVLQDHWQYMQRITPRHRTWAGERAQHLPVVSLGFSRQQAAFARAALRALDDVLINALPEDQYISWLTMYWDMTALQRIPSSFTEDLSLIAPSASPLRMSLDVLRQQPLADTTDASLFLRLVSEFASLTDSIRAGLAWRASRGVTIPRLVLPRASLFVRSFLGSGDSSPLAIAGARLEGADSLQAARFQRRLADSIAQRVNPALERLAQYLEGEYAAVATERIGLGQFPGGLPRYRSLVKFYSTLEITPEEAHATGLREAEVIGARVAAWRQQLGFPTEHDSLMRRLRAEPTNAVSTSVTVLERILAEYSRMAAVTSNVITRSPESTADVQAVDAPQEAIAPLGEYTPPSVTDARAHYRFNTHRWRDRSLLTLPAIVYRDLLPGRHILAALEAENSALPAFRRVANHAGHVEGWGAYAIALSDSLAAAHDSTISPLSRFGAVLQRLSIAVGLVVDTGINYFGWTRDQALSFLRVHLPFDDAELEREFIFPAVELPGSLVAGALGAREFRGLRRWAERELGDHFDLRAFHDEVLRVGSVPLPVLGTHLEWWIWRERTKSAPDTGSRSSVNR